jgi:steroid delta-isomerase-like uncharacterized protein
VAASHKDTVIALFDAWHQRDLDKVTSLMTPDFEYATGSVRMPSPGQFCQMARDIWTATPDEHVELVSIIDDGDKIAVEARTTATHTGPLRFGGVELPASNRKLDIGTAFFFSFKDGLIHRWNEYGDLKAWIEQMGATITITPGHDS